MMLEILIREIQLLYRSEIYYGIPARMTVARLIIDYFRSFEAFEAEPPIPEYPPYVWPEGLTTHF
jgi:hypothetical protein